MTGTFILSLDCEGKWGMADHIGPQHDSITCGTLTATYQDLCDLLREHGVTATFAFVSAFAMNEQERTAFAPHIGKAEGAVGDWLAAYRQASARGNLSGWHCPDALDRVRAAGHEIANHGFRHMPFGGPGMDAALMAEEINEANAFAARQGMRLRTFIYPRNQVARPDLLRSAGLIGYREAPRHRSRLGSLLSEFNIGARAQPHGTVHDGLVQIPSGYFLNWQYGLRKLVPVEISRARWRSILTDACTNDRVAHLWLHPHNLITGPGTRDLLKRMLDDVTEAVSRGCLQVQTQEQYCEAILSAQHDKAILSRMSEPALRAAI